MTDELQAKLEQLVALKSQVEMLTEQRKDRQQELLNDDEVYANFKALEDEKQAEYDALREEVAKMWKELDVNWKIQTSNWAVSFSYVRNYVMKDEEKFMWYCKSKNILEQMYKMELRKTEFKKYVANAEAEGQSIDWVDTEETVAIAVSVNKK